MEIVIAVVILALVGLAVLSPMLRERVAVDHGNPRIRDLQAQKESKYREIRDVELDHASGKLSDEEFRRLDRELRAEAIRILRELDELGAG